KTRTTKVQVRADPRGAVTLADLKEQHDVALAIRDLTSRANTLLEQTDGMARQLTSINQTLRPGVGANARSDSAIAVQQGATSAALQAVNAAQERIMYLRDDKLLTPITR